MLMFLPKFGADVEVPFGADAEVPFGTWDGTERSGTRRFIPRLVRLKTWNGLFYGTKFGWFFVPPPPPGTTGSTSVEHKFIIF